LSVFNFIQTAIKNPISTGAVAPSSRFLAREILRYWPEDKKGLIVEYGPGTGAFTKVVDQKLNSENYVGLELNPDFTKNLNKFYPHLDILEKSAADLPEVIQSKSLPNPSLIISGLPWANFNPELQKSILGSTVENLDQEGTFSTFAYVHALKLKKAQAFKGLLQDHFSDVATSKVIWRNLPPAVIYHCRKPLKKGKS